jgi:hypothetical protein
MAQKQTAGESEGTNTMQWKIRTQKHMKNKNRIRVQKEGGKQEE